MILTIFTIEIFKKVLKSIKNSMKTLTHKPKIEKTIDETLAWIGSNIERRKWTDNEIVAKFAKRGANQIMEDGHIFYLNPCVDFGLVFLELMKRKGIPGSLVIEEMVDPRYGYSLHFATEVSSDGKTFYVDFPFQTYVIIAKGKYIDYDTSFDHIRDIQKKDRVKHVKNTRIDTKLIDANVSLLDLVDDKTNPASAIIQQILTGEYSHRQQLERLKDANTDSQYKAILGAFGNRGLRIVRAYQ